MRNVSQIYAMCGNFQNASKRFFENIKINKRGRVREREREEINDPNTFLISR